MLPCTLFLRPSAVRTIARQVYHPALLRCYSDQPPRPFAPPGPPVGPGQDTLPHVAKEAPAAAGITGGTEPELEQGTPIQNMINRSTEAWEDVSSTPSPTGSYSTSTLTPATSEMPLEMLTPEGGTAATSEMPLKVLAPEEPLPEGAKFPLPELPIPARAHMKHRYSPLVEQVTNFLMRHGKKATAQSNVFKILSILRTKPAPSPSQSFTPLIPGTPPLATLPSDPILYLQTAIDSVAPLMKIISVKGAGGSTDHIPSPLNITQRRRTALQWIMATADKRAKKNNLAERVADEIIAVVEGRSPVWEKRNQLHKQAIQARANVSTDGSKKSLKNRRRFPYN